MENVSKFNSAFSFKSNVVKSGGKVSSFAVPTFSVDSTKDKFTLDSKALALIGITEGDKVVLIDMNTDDVNNRFFITKGWDLDNGEVSGAKIGKNNSFSYSKIWAAMLIGEQGVTEAKPIDLVKMGLATATQGVKSIAYIATKKLYYTVSQLIGEDGEDEFEVAEGVTQAVYKLSDVAEKEHTARTISDDVEVEEVEETEAYTI